MLTLLSPETQMLKLRMKPTRLLLLLTAISLFPVGGCGNSGPANVIESADEEALENYRRLAEESEARDEQDWEGEQK